MKSYDTDFLCIQKYNPSSLIEITLYVSSRSFDLARLPMENKDGEQGWRRRMPNLNDVNFTATTIFPCG